MEQRTAGRALLLIIFLLLVFLSFRCSNIFRSQNTLSASDSKPFLSNTLGSNMVLQRDQLSVLWGWTSLPNVVVSVYFQDEVFSLPSDDSGKWSIALPAQKATAQPQTIEIKSASGETATLSNVLFGDVYICGGQSNMQMSVAGAFNASIEIQKANNYPNIRLFTVGQSTTSVQPLDSLKTIEQGWTPASSASVGNGPWSYFSATCWFTAVHLYDELGVPLGLVSNNWGGTCVQAWTSSDAVSKCTGYSPAPGCNPSQPDGPNCPSNLFNAMISPFLPMRLTGVLWYQGEQNADQPTYYACGFPLMIRNWREKFNYPSLPFFFVQLAPWDCGSNSNLNIGHLRISQLAALALPKVGFATAIDLGDDYSPLGNIHPRDKQAVGKRLSDSILSIVYNQKKTWFPPAFTNFTSSVTSGGLQVDLTFSPITVQGKLTVTSPSCPPNAAKTACSGFEVLVSGKWLAPTQSKATSKNVVSLMVPSIKTHATGVRYDINCWPLTSVFDSTTNLPALPFDTTTGHFTKHEKILL